MEKTKKNENTTIKKKRGRKPKNIIDNNLNNIQITNIYKQSVNLKKNKKNHILHLKLPDLNKIENNLKKIPVAYNSFLSNNRESINNIKSEIPNDKYNYFKNKTEKVNNFNENYNNSFITKEVYKTYLSLIGNDNNWPKKTNLSCMWCVHPFETTPIGIPKSYNNNVFRCSGCFCSFNCAASFIFDRKNYNMWEEYNLLNLLAKKIFNKNIKIKLAPDRYTLNIFGGVLSINDFRKNFNEINTSYVIHEYPLISINSQIEKTTDDNEYKFLPLKKSLIKEAEYYKSNNKNNIKENFKILNLK